jgi:hypothetical protein
MQDNALSRQFLFDRTRHVSSSFDVTCTRQDVIGFTLFRALRLYMQANAVQGGLPLSAADAPGPKTLWSGRYL